MEVYKSDFITISIDQDNSIIRFIWSSKTNKMTEDDFRKELLKENEFIEMYKPKNILVKTLKFAFSIVPETQLWINEYIYPTWAKSGVKKMAIMVSKEFIAQLSLEQTVDENSYKEIVSNFFESEKSAIEWLMQ